jgi:hypothetical protein
MGERARDTIAVGFDGVFGSGSASSGGKSRCQYAIFDTCLVWRSC